MLRRTHLAIGLFAGIYFLPHVPNKLSFIPLVLIASLLPDIDSGKSFFGKKWFSKPVQAFSDHRGIFHTYTLCILASLVLAFFVPVLAFPFFLGYSFHLLADSFTLQGIKPFWPLKVVSKGVVRTGGRLDDVVFWVFVFVDVFLAFFLFL